MGGRERGEELPTPPPPHPRTHQAAAGIDASGSPNPGPFTGSVRDWPSGCPKTVGQTKPNNPPPPPGNWASDPTCLGQWRPPRARARVHTDTTAAPARRRFGGPMRGTETSPFGLGTGPAGGSAPGVRPGALPQPPLFTRPHASNRNGAAMPSSPRPTPPSQLAPPPPPPPPNGCGWSSGRTGREHSRDRWIDSRGGPPHGRPPCAVAGCE